MHKIDLSEAELNRGNVIVDSGTTDTYFSRVIDGPFKQIWKELTGNDYNHSPISITDAEIAALPTIILVLSAYEGSAVGDEPKGNPDTVPGYAGTTGIGNPRDVVLAIPAAHYLEYDPDIGKYVPRFYTDEGGGSVLGANAMMGHDVFFDNSRKRIGFAESNCDYTSLLLNEGPLQNQEESNKIEVPVNEEPASEITGPELNGGTDDEVETDDEIEEEIEIIEEEINAEQNAEVPVIPEPADNNNNNPYEVPAKPKQEYSSGTMTFASEMLNDMKHECASAGCRSIAVLFIIGAVAIVLVGIRRTMARRRVVRQYEEAGLEISDLALDLDSDDEGGYNDDPRNRQIT
jgi:hypothetical protein